MVPWDRFLKKAKRFRTNLHVISKQSFLVILIITENKHVACRNHDWSLAQGRFLVLKELVNRRENAVVKTELV